MRKANLIAGLAVILTGAAGLASADDGAPQPMGTGTYENGGKYDYCVSVFYDQENYGWFSVRNRCTEDLKWTTRSPNAAGTVRSGAAQSLGLSRAEMEKYQGAFEMAVCRAGFIPVDANDNYWAGGGYRCKAQ